MILSVRHIIWSEMIRKNSWKDQSAGKKDQLIFHGEVAFWNKLIHKDLLHQTGKIPQIWFEDTAYMLPVFSYAQNPGYLDEPLYFYIKRRFHHKQYG
ncbi:MAG: hypothetical protein ACLVI9_04670 [Anaerostipes hadrus]